METFGTAKIADEKIAALINEHFDLRPGAIISDLKLRQPSYRKTATYATSAAMISSSSGNAPIK